MPMTDEQFFERAETILKAAIVPDAVADKDALQTALIVATQSQIAATLLQAKILNEQNIILEGMAQSLIESNGYVIK